MVEGVCFSVHSLNKMAESVATVVSRAAHVQSYHIKTVYQECPNIAKN